MEKIFSDIKNSARSAMKKSGELLELTKQKLAIADTKSEIQTKFVQLGEMVYEAKKNDGDIGDLEQITQELDALCEKLSEQEARLAELKKQKICSSCGDSCDAEASYCSRCGAKFEEDETHSV